MSRILKKPKNQDDIEFDRTVNEKQEFELKSQVDGTVHDRPENKDKSTALVEAAEQQKARNEKPKNSDKKSNSNRTKGYYLSEENHKWLSKEALMLSLDGDERVTASSLLEEIINKHRGKAV